jgi:hypothetical protein
MGWCRQRVTTRRNERRSRAFALLPISSPGLPFPNARAAETDGRISRSNFERKGYPSVCHDIVIARSVGANAHASLPHALHSQEQLETAYFAFRLSASQPGERVSRDCSSTKHGADLSTCLVHRRDRGCGNIRVIGEQRSDDINRTRALVERFSCIAIGLHAGEDIFGARRCRIVIGGRGPGGDFRSAREIDARGQK